MLFRELAWAFLVLRMDPWLFHLETSLLAHVQKDPGPGSARPPPQLRRIGFHAFGYPKHGLSMLGNRYIYTLFPLPPSRWRMARPKGCPYSVIKVLPPPRRGASTCFMKQLAKYVARDQGCPPDPARLTPAFHANTELDQASWRPYSGFGPSLAVVSE